MITITAQPPNKNNVKMTWKGTRTHLKLQTKKEKKTHNIKLYIDAKQKEREREKQTTFDRWTELKQMNSQMPQNFACRWQQQCGKSMPIINTKHTDRKENRGRYSFFLHVLFSFFLCRNLYANQNEDRWENQTTG